MKSVRLVLSIKQIKTLFSFPGLNLYSAYGSHTADQCETIGLHHVICHSLYGCRAVFSVLAMCWNLLVGCVLMSVCRTHTIGEWVSSVVWHHSLLLMNSFNKTEAAVFSCRLCFLMAFPFIILVLEFDACVMTVFLFILF